jgi:hypothetical protein
MATVGILFPGDPDARGTWSGTPAGLAGGLEELGHVVRRIDARAPWLLDRVAFNAVALARTRPRRRGVRATLREGRAVARVAPETAAVRGLAVARRLRRLRGLDALVQIGTGYATPAGLPVATFEDMTIPQAVRLGYPGWGRLSARAVDARMDLQRRAYERAAACCLATEWAAESVTADYGIDPGKVHAVGLGRNYDPRPASRDWATPRFLFVGADWEGKNGPRLLRAFARLRAELPAAELHLVGAHPRAVAAGVTGHGFLDMGDAGDRARLEALYQASTCLVVPSLREAFGMVYAEAAAAGLPAIGTSAGGPADVIRNGGCVVDPHDDDALLAAMRRLADPDVARAAGAAALARADLFTWRAVAGRVARALALPAAGGAPAAAVEPGVVDSA